LNATRMYATIRATENKASQASTKERRWKFAKRKAVHPPLISRVRTDHYLPNAGWYMYETRIHVDGGVTQCASPSLPNCSRHDFISRQCPLLFLLFFSSALFAAGRFERRLLRGSCTSPSLRGGRHHRRRFGYVCYVILE
jgi:hypothetical protein